MSAPWLYGKSGGSGSLATYVIDTPEAHGAKRDGKLLTGCTYVHSTKTVTAPGAAFVSGDVGKVFVLRQSGTKLTFVTTIASVTDGTHVVLTTDVVGADLGSTFMLYGTDDTAAINTAITSIVSTAQTAGRNAGQLLLSDGIYVIAGATTKTTTNLGNAQIPLPAIRPDLKDKFELDIRGVADGSAPQHWYSPFPQLSGSVLFSTLQGVSNDSTWGFPAVIGSITSVALNNNGFASGYGGSNNNWSNCHLSISNLRIVVPNTPALTAMDLRGLGTASIDKVGIIPFNTPAEINSGLPANGTVGVYMPSLNNNDLSEIGSITIYNYNYGLGVSDHCNWKSARFIFCNSAVLIAGPNGADTYVHGIKGGYTSIEGCAVGIDASVFTPITSGIPRFPVVIDEINFEVHSSYHVNDSHNYLTGQIWMSDINESLNINGAQNLRITDGFRARGAVTAPTLPATGVALQNPFWRDAAVTLTGGSSTGITVDGQSLGIGSGSTVIVPSGKSITVAYSATPTWKWTLL
jgi:hypothetical protein